MMKERTKLIKNERGQKLMKKSCIFVSIEEIEIKGKNEKLYKYNLLDVENNQIFSIYKNIMLNKQFGQEVELTIDIIVNQGKLALKIVEIQ